MSLPPHPHAVPSPHHAAVGAPPPPLPPQFSFISSVSTANSSNVANTQVESAVSSGLPSAGHTLAPGEVILVWADEEYSMVSQRFPFSSIPLNNNAMLCRVCLLCLHRKSVAHSYPSTSAENHNLQHLDSTSI